MDTNKMFIDMARQAREFAEMCCLMQKMPGMPLTAEVKDALDEYAKRLGLLKADPEAWRERNRQRQAAGVKFDFRYGHGVNDWSRGKWDFDEGNKEDYREVPYEPKPTKLTAKIICKANIAYQSFAQDWEFYGTPEEYVAQCEKYGYVVVSEIKEVVEKPKTVKRYMAMLKYKTDPPFSCVMDSCHTITLYATRKGYNIIGNIEEREVPIE